MKKLFAVCFIFFALFGFSNAQDNVLKYEAETIRLVIEDWQGNQIKNYLWGRHAMISYYPERMDYIIFYKDLERTINFLYLRFIEKTKSGANKCKDLESDEIAYVIHNTNDLEGTVRIVYFDLESSKYPNTIFNLLIEDVTNIE